MADVKTDPVSTTSVPEDHGEGKILPDVTISAALDITKSEHDLSVRDAVRNYPKAVAWAMFFCLAVIMTGFDGQIISSFYALPAFQKNYGVLYEGEYLIPAKWQTALGMGSPIGQVVGALGCGWPLEKWGRKITLAVCCVYSIAWVFCQMFATSLATLCVGEIFGGLAFGFYVVVAPVYASEICPLALRGILTASVNLGWVIGQFIAQGTAAGMANRTDKWAYKIPFAVQWIWPAVLLAGLFFAPESPYWLVRQGRTDAARKSLESVSDKSVHHRIDGTLTLIEETNALEEEIMHSTTYLDCFRFSNLRRTEICTMVYLIQVIGGNPLIGYSTFFFEQAGLADAEAFYMGVGNTAMGFVGTLLSWPLMSHFGRRTIYNGGMYTMTLILWIIGFLSIGQGSSSVTWAQASLMDIWTFIYQMTVGPICFVLISEISSTRLRGRTIAIATAVQSFAGIVFTVAMPYMLSSDEANWKGKAGYLFGAISLVCCVWCWFRLPESRGRTFEEIDILFEKRVNARKFADYDLVGEAEGLQEKV